MTLSIVIVGVYTRDRLYILKSTAHLLVVLLGNTAAVR